MNAWRCVIPGRPTSKGNHKRIVKFGKRLAIIGTRAALKAAENAKAALRPQAPSALLSSKDAPCALAVDVDFCFAIPKSRKELVPGDPHIQAPDRGNLLKMTEDVLEAVAYANDCVVCDGRVRKLWGERDETIVTVRPCAWRGMRTSRKVGNTQGT